MIEVIVVDLGGVAARFTPERRLARLSALSGLPEDVIHARIFESGLEGRAELGELSPEETMSAVVAALDGRVAAAALVDAWALAFELDADVLECLKALGLRRALFTNNGPMLDACLDGPLRELRDSFDQVICSWHLRTRKPGATTFERAAKRLDCGPEHLLLLDDSDANVEAARRCGWQAERVTGVSEVAAALERHVQRY